MFPSQFRRIVTTLLGSLDRSRDEGWRWNDNRFGDAEIGSDGDSGNLSDAPFDIDGIVIGRVSVEGWASGGRHRVNVRVRRRRGSRMIQILRVNVEKWRLNEAPEKGGSAENCARCPHDYLC